MPTLHIRLLGQFQLIYEGQPVTTIHQPRQQSLLAYLLLHQETSHRRRDIAFLFWPDVPERQAFANLRKALHRLRKNLPNADQFLQIDAKLIAWRTEASFSLDVTDFEAKLAEAEAAQQAGYHTQAAHKWAGAAELYGGDLLPHCYDEWLLPERERRHQQFIGALTQLGDWQERQRDVTAAIQTTRRLLRHDPLHEATHRRLMQLHLLNGEPAEALRVYHVCTTLLQQELNVAPSPATQAVYERLISKTGRTLASSAKTSQSLIRLPLIGRQAEWQQLLNAWQGAARGPRCVIIGGEAGIGKSRLAEELQLWANRQGFTTAHSRAYESARQLVYAPVVDWLRSDDLQSVQQILEPIWLTEIARLLPELLTRQPDLPHPQPLSQSWQRHHLFEALSRAIGQADLPLLLVLDDLQWCDQETLDWLGYLLRFDPQTRLLLVGTVRLEEIDTDHPLTTLRRDLRRTRLLTEIELGPLDAAETTALAEQVRGRPLDPKAAKQLYQETEGNPLFIVETIRADVVAPNRADDSPAEASLPARIQAIIDFRLEQLSPPARELVAVAAVVGQAFSFEVLAAAGADDTEMVVKALDEAWQRRLIREQAQGQYDFSHGKIREVVYTGLSVARRRWLHQTVAQAIETIHQPHLDPVSSRLAHHYEQAGQYEKAVAYYGQAAQVEYALGAWSETIDLLQRELALLKTLPDTPESAQQTVNSLALLGATFAAQKGYAALEAGEAYKQALALAPQTGQLPALIAARFYLGIHHWARVDFQAAQAMGEQMFNLAQTQVNPVMLKQAHHLLGLILFYRGQFAEACDHFIPGLAPFSEPAASDLPDPSAVNLPYLALAYWFLGYPDQARQKGAEVIDLTEAIPAPTLKVILLLLVGLLHIFLREIDKSHAYIQTGLILCCKYDLIYEEAVLTIFRGWVVVQQTRATSGTKIIQQGFKDFAVTTAESNLSMYRSLLTEAYLLTGQLEAGLDTLDQAIHFIQRSGERFMEAEIYRLKGELLLAQDDDQQVEAEAAFQHALTVARRQQAKSLELRAAISLARLWQQQGRIKSAHALLSEIYGWFTEGFDTHDLQAAQQLLEQLSTP